MLVPANVIVTGAPRSGTSLVAGLFAAAGHHPGARLIPATTSNPAGFFESLDVNAANDRLLDAVAGAPVHGTQCPPPTVRWLGAFAGPVAPSAGQQMDLARWVPPPPFVLKDPRFTYTLPAWRPVLGAVQVVVVVRHPSEVVASLTSMAAREPETFDGFAVTTHHALAMWEAMYRAVLTAADEDTTFVRLADVRRGPGRERVGAVAGTYLDPSGVRRELRRERARQSLPETTSELLAVLDARCGPGMI